MSSIILMKEILCTFGNLARGSEDHDEIIEYCSNVVDDEDFDWNIDSMLESIGPFLMDAGLCSDEEVVRKVCDQLATAKGKSLRAASSTSAKPEDIATTRKLDQAVGLGQSDGRALTDVIAKFEQPGALGSRAQAVVDHTTFEVKITAEQRDAEKRAFKAAAQAEKVAALQQALADEILRGRLEVAKLRAKEGAPRLGSIELGPTNIPNPGGGADLIEDASCVFVPGHRYGLLGRNGKGKSTLLKHMAARRMSGLPPPVSIYYVTQDLMLKAEEEEWTPIQYVLAQDVERKMLIEEAERLVDSADLKDINRHGEIEMRLEEIGSATAEARVKTLLRNLGFTEALMGRAMKSLSGGWKVRTALTAALFAQPDLLLLDEPTNHLSIDAVLWLSRELASSDIWSSRIIVVVSHDRCFLEDTCTDMCHISGVARRITQHPGRFSTWAARREEQQIAWKRRQELRQARREKMNDHASCGYKYGGSAVAMNMQSRMQRQIKESDKEAEAEEEALADLNEDGELPLTILAGGMLAKTAVQMFGVGFGYPGSEKLFRAVEMSVDSRSRICLLGENGQGKTTLLKLIMDTLMPSEGSVSRSPGSRIELVSQHHADQLDFDQTPLSFMLQKFPGNRSYDHEQALRSHLAQCGIEVGQQMTPARALSGGQRSRVALAATSYSRPHVLVLDEPTNNLDLEACVALADSVEGFQGGVVIVSHDQFFIERVAKEIWVVEDGVVKRVESFKEYKKSVLKKARLLNALS